VNFVFPYSALRAANVQGTEEVLRLATTTRAKAVHHFSAVDVFVSGEQGDEEMSEDALPAREPAAHGYVQTKWVSERLVVAARERGLPTCVYRPWIVMGHSGTGVGHLSDLMYLVLKGCITLEQAPAIDLTVNVVPVDYVAAAVAYLSLQEDSFGRTFHFANPHPAHVSAMYDVIRSVGYRLDEVSWAEWRARATEVGPDHALYSVAPLFRPEALYPEELNPRIDATNTLRGLDGSGIACPPLDERLMRTYLARLIDDEWIPAPAHARAAAG
jgi:myxalamid-type nonribosomal peptide synthetase MxaA